MERKRILVVDDDDRWLKTVKRILEPAYDLSLTEDPDEACLLARTSFYSLAILDQKLSPEMTGLDLIEQLRGIQEDLRCIILTGYADLEDAVNSMKSGAIDYISKGRPDLQKSLQERVGRILEEGPREAGLVALLKAGENAEVEFKETVRWDTRLKRVNKELEGVIVRTVAAFLNSEAGGTLLIGVDDSAQVRGLQADLETLSKPNKDSFEIVVVNLLTGSFGKEVSRLLRIDFPLVGGVEICRISVKPSHKPVYVSEGSSLKDFYIRSGNSTRKLNTEEAIEFSKVRWRW